MTKIYYTLQEKYSKNLYIEKLCDDLIIAFKTSRDDTTLYFNSIDDLALFKLKYNL